MYFAYNSNHFQPLHSYNIIPEAHATRDLFITPNYENNFLPYLLNRNLIPTHVVEPKRCSQQTLDLLMMLFPLLKSVDSYA